MIYRRKINYFKITFQTGCATGLKNRSSETIKHRAYLCHLSKNYLGLGTSGIRVLLLKG